MRGVHNAHYLVVARLPGANLPIGRVGCQTCGVTYSRGVNPLLTAKTAAPRPRSSPFQKALAACFQDREATTVNPVQHAGLGRASPGLCPAEPPTSGIAGPRTMFIQPICPPNTHSGIFIPIFVIIAGYFDNGHNHRPGHEVATKRPPDWKTCERRWRGREI